MLSVSLIIKSNPKEKHESLQSPTAFLSTAPPSHDELHITLNEVTEFCILVWFFFCAHTLFADVCVSPVLRKGQVVTGYYRWLQRRGGYLWVQSCATVSINHKAPHERNVIWVNYILRSAL